VKNIQQRAPLQGDAANISALTILALAMIATVTIYPIRAWSLTFGIAARASNRSNLERSPVTDFASAPSLVQDDTPSADDDKDVPPKMVEKYTNAYKAMQKDHNITADQAAAAQGLTIAQFRSIEGRIERDDTLRERVRKALRAATPGSNDGKDSANQ